MSLLDHPERDAVYRTPSISDAPTWSARVVYSGRAVIKHITKHVGVGIICSVAYFDPYVSPTARMGVMSCSSQHVRGNWSVDMQAGSIFGYRPMLFVILIAGLGAMILQVSNCPGCAFVS